MRGLEQLSIQCPAKINLTLGILGRRTDGYHELETIMQSISLVDTLHFLPGTTGLELTSDDPNLPSGEDNLVYRAAALLMKYVGRSKPGVCLQLEKRIPVAAGLAGGSTDAAGALKGLNRFWNLGLTFRELEKLGAQLGSDVPFCIRGGTALARGRGEQLTPLSVQTGWWLVLVKPPIEVSTAQVYSDFRLQQVEKQPDTRAMVDSLKKGNLKSIGKNLVNVLETVTIKRHPIIGEIKAEMIKRGAVGALMSGSGPTVLGVVEGQQAAVDLANSFRDQFTAVYTARTLSPLESNP